jgi:hypothetical protein
VWAVKGTCLLGDGYLPRDSIWADSYRRVFFEIKSEIDFAFKVERPPYIFVWWFDEYVGQTLDLRFMVRPVLGKFYPIDLLVSDSQKEIGQYLESLGYQVRFALMSIDRQEYVVLAVFSAQGAILEEAADAYLKVLEYEEPCPMDDWGELLRVRPPIERELVLQ